MSSFQEPDQEAINPIEVLEQMDVPAEEVEAMDELQIVFNELDAEGSVDESKWQVLLQNERSDELATKIKEQCIYRLSKIYTEARNFDTVMTLLQSNNEFFSKIPKARTAKIVRNILNLVSAIPDTLDIQVRLCEDVIAWCKAEKRTFLRQRIEARLATLLLQQHKPAQALVLVNGLLGELKKLDDKQMLTEVHLTESRIYQALENIPKSKASLTASRTAANSIYVVPLLQAEIDEMSGVLHCEEGDHTTAFSYFLEAFDAYDQCSDPRAVTCLKYMILAKVLADAPNDVPGILSGKMGMKHSSPALTAMAVIAKAAQKRSLEDFQAAVTAYQPYLHSDALISHQLAELFQKMLESNLIKIIQPYSVVDIAHVAKQIKLPEAQVEKKLSQMILDRRIFGILDQGAGCLIVNTSSGVDKSFEKGVEIITNMGAVVDALLTRAKGVAKAAV